MSFEKGCFSFIVGAMLFGGISACVSRCKQDQRRQNIDAHIESYMADRPQSEYQDIRRIYWTPGARKSALDSLAYREIFMGTHAAKDSFLLKEFNKVAATMKPGVSSQNLSKIMTHKEFKQLENESKGFLSGWDGLTYQFKADSVAYKRFFEKHGLLNDSTLKKFAAVTKKIRS